MKFIDEAIIRVSAGRGGQGAKSFHREKYVPFGGPDGGNGGPGGDVILRVNSAKTSLLDFQHRPHWKAESGRPGQGGNKDGKSGEDLIIEVPSGTQILKLGESSSTDSSEFAAEPEMVADLVDDRQEFILASGGRGGKGNAFFKSATNRTPEQFQPGEEGQQGTYLLSLKLVADIALVGFPNAGKSTLISQVSAAKPKIADYPFTTLTPNLGVVGHGSQGSFVVADVPGLIPGASQGKGLGIRFLKHIERTKLITFLLDPLQLDENGRSVEPFEAFRMLSSELEQYSMELAERPRLVVINKIDAFPEREKLGEIMGSFEKGGESCLAVSAVSGEGVSALKETWHKRLHVLG
ncbi:MAG: GTPase ObgE [Proteobacteria bacterium]|nr:MAG: GTPase ObgE [Pseudomonadota bacterium]